MGEAEEFPLRERFGYRELQLHLAVVVRDELREKEGGFVQIFTGCDGTEIRTFWLWCRCFAPLPRYGLLSQTSIHIINLSQSQRCRSGRCLCHIKSHRPCHSCFG